MKELKMIPMGYLGGDLEIERIRKSLLKHEKMYVNDDGSFGFIGDTKDEKEKESKKKKDLIPLGVVGATQWYEKDPERFKCEVIAMRKEYNNPYLEPHFSKSGNMYWIVDIPVKIEEELVRTYKMLLMYDYNHPHAAHGTSVKGYPIRPSIDEMIGFMEKNSKIKNKSLPHTIGDENGHKYLCSISSESTNETNSAVTSKRRLNYWLILFELGLRDPKIMEEFQTHGMF